MATLIEALTFAGRSDIGLVSDNNEDKIALAEQRGLALLADGIGGHNAGEVASAIAIQSLLDGLHTADASDHGLAQLQAEIARANRAVFAHAQAHSECAGMGTTIVACWFHDDFLSVGHIGDSRLYRLRNDVFECLTRDHSVLQEYIDAGYLSKEEARHSGQKNLVTRALGVQAEENADMQQFALEVGDIYLLCSDGLNDMVEDDDIELNLSMLQGNLDICAEHLIQAANDAGGRDNVSVILVRVNASMRMPVAAH